ncbi:MAG: type II secretion system protein [Bacilli bacterium]|nr:type II secretion system protein [Bacilli bacterium]
MKKKQGFTLVELLAVIGIIGILVTIASASVVSVLNKQKETLAADTEKKLKDAAIAYIQDKKIRLTSCPSNFDPKNPGSQTSCYRKIKVAEIINQGLFDDTAGHCNKEAYIIVYKSAQENYKENIAYAEEGICK